MTVDGTHVQPMCYQACFTLGRVDQAERFFRSYMCSRNCGAALLDKSGEQHPDFSTVSMARDPKGCTCEVAGPAAADRLVTSA